MKFFLKIYLENIQYFGFAGNQESRHLNSPQTFLKIYTASTAYM